MPMMALNKGSIVSSIAFGSSPAMPWMADVYTICDSTGRPEVCIVDIVLHCSHLLLITGGSNTEISHQSLGGGSLPLMDGASRRRTSSKHCCSEPTSNLDEVILPVLRALGLA